MAGRFNLEEYETVQERLVRFWESFPQGRVITKLLHQDDKRFIVQAEIFADREDTRPIATGLAEETIGSSMVNKTSPLENGETSAIGRAISNSFLGNVKAHLPKPSRQEMEKVQRKQITDEMIEKIKTVKALVDICGDKVALKSLWDENDAILDTPFENTSLRNIILEKKAQLG